jgi:hypothetical protein
MRRSVLLAAVLLTVVAFGAPGGAASLAGPRCGDVLTTSVVLTADLVCSGDALTIPGYTEVTLDLNGHSIVGSGVGSGVRIVPALNENLSSPSGHVIVENGSIRRFEIGIQIRSNTTDPSELPGDESVQLNRLFISDNATGVLGGQDGTGPDTTVSDSTIAGNQSDGVRVGFLRPFRLINDHVRNNAGSGINTFGADSISLLKNSFIAHNAGYGASLQDTQAVIEGNTFLGNGQTGLSIEEDICQDIPFYVVSDNVADGNGGGGMGMFSLPFCDPGPPDGSGNVARHNADFQCVLIVCTANPGQAKTTGR